MSNFMDYLVPSNQTPRTWWLFRFPDDSEIQVQPDPAVPFRFDVISHAYTVSGRTTDQVEALLADAVALSSKDGAR